MTTRMTPPARSPSPPRSVSDFLQWSFDALEVRMPEGFQRLCKSLSGCTIVLNIDGERFVVRFEVDGAEILTDQSLSHHRGVGVDVEALPLVETNRNTILAVIDAKLSLEQAVLSGELEVTAPLEQLQQLLDGLMLYVHCGVRCSTFPAILSSFRSFHRYQFSVSQLDASSERQRSSP